MPLSSTPSKLADGNGRCSTSPSRNSTSGYLRAAELDQLRADVEADAVVAGALEQVGERARAAAEIGDAGARLAARLSRAKASTRRALDSGVNTSYSSAAAWRSKNAISFCLSCCLSWAGAMVIRFRSALQGQAVLPASRCCSTISASSAMPPCGSATNGLMSTDWIDVLQIDGEPAERDQRVDHRLDIERRRAAIAAQQLGARACARACRAPCRGSPAARRRSRP